MKLRITILFLFLTQIVDSQTLDVPFYDSHEIVSIIDSLRSIKVNQILIVQTERLRMCNHNRDSITTTIIWSADSGYFNLMTICSNVIFLPIKTKLDNPIMDEKFITRLLMTKDEDIYRFVPPLINANAIFYISNKQHGYFEQGDNQNSSPMRYVPKNSLREKRRKGWFELVIKNLQKVDYSFRLSRFYYREKEMR